MHGLNWQTDTNQIALNYGVYLSINCNRTIKILNAVNGVRMTYLLLQSVSQSDYLILYIMHLIAYV